MVLSAITDYGQPDFFSIPAAAIVPRCLRGAVRPVGMGLLRYPKTWRALVLLHDEVLGASAESMAPLDARFWP